MIYLGADHNGFKLKEKIKKYLDKRNISYMDMGAFEYKKRDDYPDFASIVAKQVANSKNNKGILLCGTGNGMAIAANKYQGIKAALAWNKKTAKMGVLDDHANILVLPAWLLKEVEALAIVSEWLKTRPSKAIRHKRRVAKVKKLGQKV